MAAKRILFFKRMVGRVKQDNERGAREKVIEELFNDFNRSRVQVYKINFVRGIVFGAGTVIGGSVVIAMLAWFLAWLGTVFPPLHDLFGGVAHLLDHAQK